MADVRPLDRPTMQLESQQNGVVGLGQRVHACSQTQVTGSLHSGDVKLH